MDFEQLKNEVYNCMIDGHKAVLEKSAEIAEIDDKLQSGLYAISTMERLKAAKPEKEKEIENIKQQTIKAAGDIVDRYIEECQAADAINPDDITDDVKILQLPTTAKRNDLMNILKRNEDNSTMQQIVLRYAEEHGIDLDGLLYVGHTHTDEIESAKGLKGSFQPYFLHWIGDTRDNGKFFERVLKS